MTVKEKPKIHRKLFLCRECGGVRTQRGREYRWNSQLSAGFFICRRCDRIRRKYIADRRSRKEN